MGVTNIIPSLNFGELELNKNFNMADPLGAANRAAFPTDVQKLENVLNAPEVLFVGPDHYVQSRSMTSPTPLSYTTDMKIAPGDVPKVEASTTSNWGLQFLAGKPLTGKGDYKGMGLNGAEVDVYIVGTGISADHAQLKGNLFAYSNVSEV